MSNGDLNQDVARAEFRIPGADDPIPVHFNPSSLQYEVTNNLREEGEGTGEKRQFVTKSTAKLSFDLVYDTTASGHNVQVYTRRIANLMRPAESGEPAPENCAECTRVPRPVTFGWGAFEFTGFVESYKEVIEFFSMGGVPLRSVVSLTLASSEHVFDDQDSQGDAQRPEVEVDVQGDFTQLATRAGDPGAGRELGRVNDAESLRHPNPAQKVTVPGGVDLKEPSAFASNPLGDLNGSLGDLNDALGGATGSLNDALGSLDDGLGDLGGGLDVSGANLGVPTGALSDAFGQGASAGALAPFGGLRNHATPRRPSGTFNPRRLLPRAERGRSRSYSPTGRALDAAPEPVNNTWTLDWDHE